MPPTALLRATYEPDTPCHKSGLDPRSNALSIWARNSKLGISPLYLSPTSLCYVMFVRCWTLIHMHSHVRAHALSCTRILGVLPSLLFMTPHKKIRCNLWTRNVKCGFSHYAVCLNITRHTAGKPAVLVCRRLEWSSTISHRGQHGSHVYQYWICPLSAFRSWLLSWTDLLLPWEEQINRLFRVISEMGFYIHISSLTYV